MPVLRRIERLAGHTKRRQYRGAAVDRGRTAHLVVAAVRAVICGLLALCLGCSRKGAERIQIDEPFETKDCFPADKPVTGEYGQAVILELGSFVDSRGVWAT